MLACGTAPARAQATDPAPAQPSWAVSIGGGTTSRDGDRTRAYGSVALSRKLGRFYVRASAMRFGSAVRQVDATLPSRYTIGFLSAGGTFGAWFVDIYGALGRQHYLPIRTDLGSRPLSGATHSGVKGAGGDLGYVKWLGPHWSLTPSASIQYIASRALRHEIGPRGPEEYETRERGATFGGTVRADRWFGPGDKDSVGLHVGRLMTTNQSAALASGTRGTVSPNNPNARLSDGWTDFGGHFTLLVTRNLYFDGAASRTMGAASGDITTSSLGARFLF